MIDFHPYVIIFKMTPPRVILKKSLLTHLRKVKNELLSGTPQIPFEHLAKASAPAALSLLVTYCDFASLSFSLYFFGEQYNTILWVCHLEIVLISYSLLHPTS
jgi:hypothetical protein